MIRTVHKFFRSNKGHYLMLALLLGILFFISIYRLPHSPATWFDEGINIGIAKSFANEGVYSLQVAPGEFVKEKSFLITTNYPVLIPVALSIKLFGSNFIAARLPMVVYLFLFCIATYLFVRRVYNKNTALLTLALIISFVPFYGNGKAVLGEVPGLFYFLLGLLFLHGTQRNIKLFFIGLSLGLSIATKPFFIILLPALAIGELYKYRKNWKFLLKRAIIIASGITIPLMIWLYTIIPEFSLSRIIKTVSYYSNSYADSDFVKLIFSNIFRFVSETTPLHFLLLLVVSIVALLLKIRKRRSINEVEIIIFVFVILNLLWYLKTPGWYRYFYPAHLLLFLSFPAALLQIIPKRLAIIFIVCLILFQSAFLFYKKDDLLYYSTETVKTSEYIQEHLPVGGNILVINGPSLAFLIKNREVYQYLQINPTLHFGVDMFEDLKEESFDNIIINGSLFGLANKEDVEKYLTESYIPVNQIGHYDIYQDNTAL